MTPERGDSAGAAGREQWSSRVGFILATMGCAVGIGSIWKFPYEVGSNGGSAFVLFYLIGIVAIVLPLMFVEFAIGRRGASDTIGSIVTVAQAYGLNRHWRWVGILGVTSGFLILTFYAVIGGWALGYLIETILTGLPAGTAQAVQQRFDGFLAAPMRMIVYHAAFLIITAFIVARGIAGGIEAASKVLMPILMLLIVVLAVFAVATAGFRPTLRYLFAFDLTQLSARVALEALGLAFFSIGVGLGVMIVYAAYAARDVNLTQVALATVVGDTAISFCAGFAIFPIVFAQGLDPSSGPGLMFITLPLAFTAMPFGTLAAITFFLLLTVAALASAISLLEMPVAVVLRRYGWRRVPATIVTAAVCFVLGLATVFSFNIWSHVHPLAMIPGFRQFTIYDGLDFLTSNLMLPIGGCLLAIMAGWALPRSVLQDELGWPAGRAAMLRILLRYLVPAGILAATLGPLFD